MDSSGGTCCGNSVGWRREERLNIEVPVEAVSLPILSRTERLSWEYELLGMTPGDHVMELYREALRARGVLSSGELAAGRDGQTVQVARDSSSCASDRRRLRGSFSSPR